MKIFTKYVDDDCVYFTIYQYCYADTLMELHCKSKRYRID